MLLYAGITSISFKYFKFYQLLVTILKQISQSAGNLISYFHLNFISHKNYNFADENLYYLINYNESSSETLRNKTNFNIKKVSIHVPTHLKPVSDNDFGHYLSGLIDGAGKFYINNSKLQLEIKFNYLDASLAYFIKKRLGYGKVVKNKNNNTLILLVAKLEGIKKF
uniref:LAGLIDADG homing endonuclease n=1 Tax=Fuscoporia gilva TaxID=40471 RepID=UPI0023D8B65C|nr:LAGLIDADG homing endonuclease [Fuscoporia gilva]WDD39627.1 LAGLIDADG homing endonuclease [Fuscoporia gilva]